MFSSGFAESAQASASSSVSSVMEVDKDASLIKVDKDDDDTLEWLADGWNEQVAADEKGEEAGGAASDGKIVVKIEDFGSVFLSSSRTSRVCADSLILRSYITYRAMLFYLYTRTIDFTPLASSFLVELDPKSENPLNSRRAFLLSKSTRTVTDIEPASAHCIYRLADKIDLQELKALAKKAIVDGFSFENMRSPYPFPMSSTNPSLPTDPLRAHLDLCLPQRRDSERRHCFRPLALGVLTISRSFSV